MINAGEAVREKKEKDQNPNPCGTGSHPSLSLPSAFRFGWLGTEKLSYPGLIRKEQDAWTFVW
jgi:hypothetical protein